MSTWPSTAQARSAASSIKSALNFKLSSLFARIGFPPVSTTNVWSGWVMSTSNPYNIPSIVTCVEITHYWFSCQDSSLHQGKYNTIPWGWSILNRLTIVQVELMLTWMLRIFDRGIWFFQRANLFSDILRLFFGEVANVFFMWCGNLPKVLAFSYKSGLF